MFLVLEARGHAEARGAKPYARIRTIKQDRCNREPGQSTRNAESQFAEIGKDLPKGPLAIMSSASGVQPVTNEERDFLDSLNARGFDTAYRAYGSQFGQTQEAHFVMGMALGSLAISKGNFYGPFDTAGYEKNYAGDTQQILLNFWGSWRGEGMALIDSPPDTMKRGDS